jgi:hypothetical protein
MTDLHPPLAVESCKTCAIATAAEQGRLEIRDTPGAIPVSDSEFGIRIQILQGRTEAFDTGVHRSTTGRRRDGSPFENKSTSVQAARSTTKLSRT